MSKKPNIFDKLTDPKLYTGAHKERFDKDGKGKGLAGRADEVAPKDLKTMVDSKSKVVGGGDNKAKSVKSVGKVEKVEDQMENMNIEEKPKKQNIFDKLTDPSKYTGAHKERFDKDGKGKGLAGRVDEVAPKDLKTMVDSKSKDNAHINTSTKVTTTEKTKSTKTTTKVETGEKKQNIFDKLTDPSKYTGAHKERFDADGKGKGIAGRVDNTGPKNLNNMVSTKK